MKEENIKEIIIEIFERLEGKEVRGLYYKDKNWKKPDCYKKQDIRKIIREVLNEVFR